MSSTNSGSTSSPVDTDALKNAAIATAIATGGLSALDVLRLAAQGDPDDDE